MAVIEHRTPEGVIGAFENGGMTKFAIWQGTVPVMVYDEKHPDFDEGNTVAASDILTNCLNSIQDGGTTAIYTLRVYPDEAKNITNKTAFRAATRFQLTPSNDNRYEQTNDGKVMVIRDRPQINGTSHNNNNLQLQQLIDANNKMFDMIAKTLQQQQETKIDKLIGFLELQNQVPKETMEDKFLKIGEMLIEKPDIIDRIGYIFKPEIYSREPVQQPISGTDVKQEDPPTKEPEMNQQNAQTEEVTLTEEQEAALTDRMNAALDTMEAALGLQTLTEALEKLALKDPDKLMGMLKWL